MRFSLRSRESGSGRRGRGEEALAGFSPLAELARKFSKKGRGNRMSITATVNGARAAAAPENSGAADKAAFRSSPGLKERDGAEGAAFVGPRVVYRDPQDVRTILQLVLTAMILIVLLLLSTFGNFYMYMRRPDRIVIDKSSGRVVMINDREYGETEAAQLGPDRLTDSDKKYVIGEFVKSLYKIDPTTRAGDLERALRMMVPGSAAKFSAYLRDQRILEKQRNESWQAVWTPQSIEVDLSNKFIA